MNQFQAYLRQVNKNEQFWDFDSKKLDTFLGRFWFSARQLKLNKEGQEQKYTVHSLHNIRYGLKRVLKDKKYPHNIITSELFSSSQELFEDACCELKKERLGSIRHYLEISPTGTTTSFNRNSSKHRSDFLHLDY